MRILAATEKALPCFRPRGLGESLPPERNFATSSPQVYNILLIPYYNMKKKKSDVKEILQVRGDCTGKEKKKHFAARVVEQKNRLTEHASTEKQTLLTKWHWRKILLNTWHPRKKSYSALAVGEEIFARHLVSGKNVLPSTWCRGNFFAKLLASGKNYSSRGVGKKNLAQHSCIKKKTFAGYVALQKKEPCSCPCYLSLPFSVKGSSMIFTSVEISAPHSSAHVVDRQRLAA